MIKINDSYWVQNNRFLAGEYPGSSDEPTAIAKLEWLVSKNINYFINLTEPGEYGLKPYRRLFDKVQADITVSIVYTKFPIPDMEAPPVSQMVKILDTIDNALKDGHNIYLHCFGGIGRTGTVVGCYFVRHGMKAQQALDKLSELRHNTPDGLRPSPETSEQRRMVLNWIE